MNPLDLSSFHIQMRNKDGYRFHHERDINYLFPLAIIQASNKLHYDLHSKTFVSDLAKQYELTPQDFAEGFAALDRFIGECSKPDHFINSNEGFRNAWVTARMDRVKPAVISIIMNEIGLILTKAYYIHCRSIIPLGSQVVGYDAMAESIDRSIVQMKQERTSKMIQHQEEKEQFVEKVEQEGIPPPQQKFDK